jgi:glycosyltransferase involved in cell wall biosynthesis
VRHDIVAICATFPGAQDRVEDGVRYVHVGWPLGYYGSILSYFAALPLALRRFDSDLVVEEFAAPFSSVMIPRLTGRPTIAVVNWLFAREKSAQYHLPFWIVERWGTRSHRRLITVSETIADAIRAMNPQAQVDVIPNGVSPEALTVQAAKENKIVFLGRMDIEQKGLDFLFEALERAAPTLDAEIVIGGDGVDSAAVKRLCVDRGLESRVQFVGRVEGEDKVKLLASAQVVCIPSRHEAQCMVAIEAMAAGSAILGFDIPVLKEVVPEDAGVLVTAFDVQAYADALIELMADPGRCTQMGERGRSIAGNYEWDLLAPRQEQVYLETAGVDVIARD